MPLCIQGERDYALTFGAEPSRGRRLGQVGSTERSGRARGGSQGGMGCPATYPCSSDIL